MKVLIVDDEPNAIKLISSYLKHFTNFELVGTFRNGLKALEFLNANTVDVIFLDINMPHLSGLSLSKMLPKETAIVFTTAYSEHAVDSYTVNTVDYLLKPISLERFTKAINKLMVLKLPVESNGLASNNSKILIKSGTQTHQVDIADILYLQKDGNYMNYHLSHSKIMARESVAEALTALPNTFIQVQKSYIVNTKAINSFTNDNILIGNSQIPIGQQYKANLLGFLK
jgi:DNA-binding LytR/AlgR family response regulator